ncbi:MAG TPA: hypothetical protein VM123_00315 [archaeon]|nr:hypothetical protein [archaeon]
MTINIYAAWIGILLGCLAGAAEGLFFHKENWLGGYGSWSRRLLRLGHVSFFGIAFINLAFALSASALGVEKGIEIPSKMFLVAAVGMPLVCYLSAIKKPFRHLFFIPAMAVILGLTVFLWRILIQ